MDVRASVDPREQRPQNKTPQNETPQDKTLGPMEGRISRFKEMLGQPNPVMFIDSPLPHHQRLNYALIGDTAGENLEAEPMIAAPHRFQIGMLKAEPGNGPAYHTHDYTECFMPMTDHQWRFYWGEREDQVDGETVIGKWDLISLPPKLWRGFELLEAESESAWLFAVLDPHDPFAFKDPYWAPYVTSAAQAVGYEADETGKMVKVPKDNAQRAEEILKRIGSYE